MGVHEGLSLPKGLSFLVLLGPTASLKKQPFIFNVFFTIIQYEKIFGPKTIDLSL